MTNEQEQTELAIKHAEEIARLGPTTGIVLMKAIEGMARTMGALSYDHAGIALRHLQELHDAAIEQAKSANHAMHCKHDIPMNLACAECGRSADVYAHIERYGVWPAQVSKPTVCPHCGGAL